MSDDFDEYELLFGGPDEEPEGKKPKRKKRGKKAFDQEFYDDPDQEVKPKKKSKAPLIILGIVGLIFAGGYLAQGIDPDDDTPPVVKKASAELQLVNLQQVSWADQLCSTLDEHEGQAPVLESPEKPVNPVKARSLITKNMSENTRYIKDLANTIEEIPEQAVQQAGELAEDTMVVDNNLKPKENVDEKVASNTRDIVSSLQGYSAAIDNERKTLNSIAKYNFNGIRDGITKTVSSLEDMESQLEDTLGKALTKESFDNAATIMAVASTTSCGDGFITEDSVRKEMSKEVSDMEVVSKIVVKQRCEQYMDNTKGIEGSKTVGSNRESCSEFLQSVSIDSKHPLAHADINTHDDVRAPVPTAQKTPGQDEGSEDKDTEENPEDKDSRDDKKTSTPKSSKKSPALKKTS